MIQPLMDEIDEVGAHSSIYIYRAYGQHLRPWSDGLKDVTFKEIEIDSGRPFLLSGGSEFLTNEIDRQVKFDRMQARLLVLAVALFACCASASVVFFA